MAGFPKQGAPLRHVSVERIRPAIQLGLLSIPDGSRSEGGSSARRRPRPSADLVARLRRGKEELRRERERLPLPEKVRPVIQLQRVVYPLLTRRRALAPWERPWETEP